MVRVLTSYHCGDDVFSSYILLNKKEDAINAAQMRGIGEAVDGICDDVELLPDYTDIGDDELCSRLPEIIHWACFVGMVAVNSGKCTPYFLLSDEGLIHELTHLLHLEEYKTPENMKRIRGLIKELKEMDLGFYTPV